MPEILPNLTPREAARMLGISYATIKQWILSGKLTTTTTPGGHHRIAQQSLAPFLAANRKAGPKISRERFQRVSGRNQLVGRIASVRIEGLLAQVALTIGDQQITAIITADAAREMHLRKGDEAAALVKATEVMIEKLS